ncbi:MAG: OmpA family protein [Pseudomonadota bacterium]
MRGSLGLVLLLVGLGALGWWAATYAAVEIEQRVTERAEAAVAASVHGARVEVSGRDITLIGLVDSEGERAALLAALDDVTGRRVVRDESDLLAAARPFSLLVDAEGDLVTVAGFVPTEAAREALEPVLGAGANELELASGAPAEWVAAVSGGVEALGALQRGSLVFEDALVSLSGLGTRAEIAAAEAALAALPGGYETAADFTIFDDGVPLSLRAETGPGGIAVEGKLPFGATAAALGLAALGQAVSVAEIDAKDARFLQLGAAGLAALRALETAALSLSDAAPAALSLTGQGTRAQIAAALDALETLPAGLAIETDLAPLDDGLPLGLTADKAGAVVTLVGKVPFGMAPASLGLDAFEEAVIASEIDAKAPDFVIVAEAGVGALAAFDSGIMVLQDALEPGGPARLRLEGQVTRAGLAAVNAALALLPGGIVPEIDVIFADDGTPMRLRALSSDGSLSLSGKVPFGSDAGVLGLDGFGDAILIAEIDGQDEDFLPLAALGLEALTFLESGQFDIVDGPEGARLALSGVALTPVERDAALAAFGAVAADADITTLDDGAPPDFDLTFDASQGVALSGKLPRGVSSAQVAEALGVAAFESTATTGLVGDQSTYANAFKILAAWLPEVERLEVSFGAAGFEAVTVTPAPGVDAELLASELAAITGVAARVLEAPPPSVDATRTNLITGQRERFSGVAWLPMFAFTPSIERCGSETDQILSDARINFVTASARLDARSVRAVNALSGAILHCLAGASELLVEVAGHTDAQGSEEGNLALSQARADAVLDALVARGIAREALTATGYGEAEPIADNGTVEGRAANRRTEIRWSTP